MTENYTVEPLAEHKKKYSPLQLACCAGSRQFSDREVVFGGVGISFLTVAVSKLQYTPNLVMMTEAGYIGFDSISSMSSPADNLGAKGATLIQGLFETFRDMQSGHVNAACLGLAQIDRFGNGNVTYVKPDVRMNGSGGGCDIASSAGRIIYIVKYVPRLFRETLDYMTNPGFLNGSPNAREEAGLVGGGPECLVTDRGIFRFDDTTHEMYLAEVFPWQDAADIEEIRADMPWDLKVAEDMKTIPPPTEKEMDAIVLLDPGKTYLEESVLKRPVAKIMLSGRTNLDAVRDVHSIYREKYREAMDRLL